MLFGIVFYGLTVSGTGYKFTHEKELEGDGYNQELMNAVRAWCGGNRLTNALPIYGDITTWDVSEIQDMNNLFHMQRRFTGVDNHEEIARRIASGEVVQDYESRNDDISNWNVSSVTNMNNMFKTADKFRGDLSKWDVSRVTNLEGIFERAPEYEGIGLDGWDTSKVTTIRWLAYQNPVFKGTGIGNWDTSNVENARSAFFQAPHFNADVSGWDVSKITDMKNMFGGRADLSTSSFTSDLSSWNPPPSALMTNFLGYAVCFRGPMWSGHSIDMSTIGTTSSDLCPVPVVNVGPTAQPSADPTATPTSDPTAQPSADPTATPTSDPTAQPSADPTATPTSDPTAQPSADPTSNPTAGPTAQPSADPTSTPTSDPTAQPSADPTSKPTAGPTKTPTKMPTAGPTKSPTKTPTAISGLGAGNNPLESGFGLGFGLGGASVALVALLAAGVYCIRRKRRVRMEREPVGLKDLENSSESGVKITRTNTNVKLRLSRNLRPVRLSVDGRTPISRTNEGSSGGSWMEDENSESDHAGRTPAGEPTAC